MGGNIGGLFVYVLALMIMYYLLVDLQWIESELPVTHKMILFQHKNRPKTRKNHVFSKTKNARKRNTFAVKTGFSGGAGSNDRKMRVKCGR